MIIKCSANLWPGWVSSSPTLLISAIDFRLIEISITRPTESPQCSALQSAILHSVFIERSIQEMEGEGATNCQLQLLDFIQLICYCCCCDGSYSSSSSSSSAFILCDFLFYWPGPNMYHFLPPDYRSVGPNLVFWTNFPMRTLMSAPNLTL